MHCFIEISCFIDYNSMVMRFHTNSLLRTWRFIYLEREHYSADSPRDVSHPGRHLLSYLSVDRVISERLADTVRKVEEQAAEIAQLKGRVDTLEVQLKEDRVKRRRLTKSGLLSNTFLINNKLI